MVAQRYAFGSIIAPILFAILLTTSLPAKAEVSTPAAQKALLKLFQARPTAVDLKEVGDIIVLLRRKVTDNPYDATLRMRLAAYLFQAGDFSGSATELKRAIAVNADDYFAHAMLARVLDLSMDEGAADIEFQRALSLKGDHAIALEYYGESLLKRGEVSQAVDIFRKACAMSASCDAFCGLSDALLSSRDVAGATKAARQAVSADPGSARAHVSLTKALLVSGDYSCAMRTARQASLLDPASPESHLALGRALFAMKEVDRACEEFRQAVSLDPLDAQARNDLGWALYGRGDVASAVNELKLALRLNPHLNEARNNLEIAINGLIGSKRH